jgi:hypothetical protein
VNARRIFFVLVILWGVAMFALAFHYEKVIHDQREYIDGGCRGRYQGAGS